MNNVLNPDENDIHIQIIDELSREMAMANESMIGFVYPEPETCEFRSVQGNALGAKTRTLAYGQHLENGTTCEQTKRYLIAVLDKYTEECRRELALVGLNRVFSPGRLSAYDAIRSIDQGIISLSDLGYMAVGPGSTYIYPAMNETMMSATGLQRKISEKSVTADSLLFYFDVTSKSYTWRHTKFDGLIDQSFQGVVSDTLGKQLMRMGQEPLLLAGRTDEARAVALYPISDPMNLYSRSVNHSLEYPKLTGVGSIYLAVADSQNGDYGTIPDWLIERLSQSNAADSWEIRTNKNKGYLKPLRTTEERLRLRYGIELSDFPTSFQEFLTTDLNAMK